MFLSHRYLVLKTICIESCWEKLSTILEIKIEALIRDWHTKRAWSWKCCQALWCVWKWHLDLYTHGIVWEFYLENFGKKMTGVNRGWGQILLHVTAHWSGLHIKENDSTLRP